MMPQWGSRFLRDEEEKYDLKLEMVAPAVPSREQGGSPAGPAAARRVT